MAKRTCALYLAYVLLLVSAVHGEKEERWSKPVQEASSRSDWVPVPAPFRDSRDHRDSEPAASAQPQVATVLRPPEPLGPRQQRLAQAPRQGRGPPVSPQQYFPGDQSHLVRFPNEPVPQLRAPQHQVFPPNFHNSQPVFLPPQPAPPGFPPSSLTQPAFQPQPIPQFTSPPAPAPVRPVNNSFVPAGPQEEVQLVYVPVEALQGQKNHNINKQKQQPPTKFKNPEEAFQDQLRKFVQQQGNTQVPSTQQLQQEEQRFLQLKEQEERRRIQEQELRQRQEQEQRIKQEQEQRYRQEQEARAKKEQEIRQRKEQEAREQEQRRKLEKEAREKEERARYEATLRQQQQQPQQVFHQRPQQQFTPSLQAQEHAFQQQLKNTQPTESPEPVSPAPHQPPLAVYMGSTGRDPVAIEDVLFALRDAHTIPVLDRLPGPKNPPPQVFVGPAEMSAPNGYTKFELPYLSSLESNRVERKVDQLPFFVAPLSFQPPNGYSKIPFPAPHVGSVVVSHGRQQRPLSPDPVVSSEDYTSSELPSISPAIPLLVNSLQSGRGPKHQRNQVEQQNLVSNHNQFVPSQQQFPHSQQQFVSHTPQFIPPQHQFVPQEQQQFVPREQQHFVPREQQQFVQHEPQFVHQPEFSTEQVFGPPQTDIPKFEEDQPITTVAPEQITTTQYTPTRRPLHTRGRPRQPTADVNAAAPPTRTRTRVQSAEAPATERRPVNRGRRPGARRTTTTPQPISEETYDSAREASHEQQQHPESQQYITTTQKLIEETPTGPPVQSYQDNVEPTFPTSRVQFQHPGFQALPAQPPAHEEQGFHALPVVPAFPQTHLNRGNFEPSFPPQVYQPEIVSEQTDVDSFNYDNVQFEAPKKVGPTRNPDAPRNRQRQHETSPTPPVPTADPTFHRSRTPVFQSTVSSTPEPLIQHSPTPAVSTPTYPSETLSITPHHVSKGEVGKVHQKVNFPFVPTPLPEYPSDIVEQHSQVSPTFNPDPELHQLHAETTPELSTVSPTEEVQYSETPTPSTLSYQTPSRPRARLPQQQSSEVSEPAYTTIRPRTRGHTTDSSEQNTPSYQSSQRFRGRGQTSREETDDATTTALPPQRVRTRIHGTRTRTTEAPALQITVGDLPRRQPAAASVSDEANTEAPLTRTRGRFRTAERGRGVAARQQITRGRQPYKTQEVESLELAKPVRQFAGASNESPVSESPVYVPDVQFESGFTPIEAQKAVLTTTTEAPETTTLRPGRGRYNNFATGTRGSQRRPQSRTTTSSDATTAAPVTSGRAYTVRSSRRQQTTPAPGARVTSVRGSRIRRPNSATTTTELPEEDEVVAPIPTGVTYIKNPYVTIHRPGNDPPATVNEVQAEDSQEISRAPEPVSRFRQHRPQAAEEEFVEQPESRYDANPVEPEYQQYYSQSPAPARTAQRHQQQYFTASTPAPHHQPKQLTATPASPRHQEQYLREEPAQQYHREEYEYEPEVQRQGRPRQNSASRFSNFDGPEYGEESQRSEQISIQQLEGALAASLFNKGAEIIDSVPVNEEQSYEVEDDKQSEQSGDVISKENNSESEVSEEQDKDISTESSINSETDAVTTEATLTTINDQDIAQSAPVETESEQTDDKPAPHTKTSEGRRRRVRVRTRKQRPGDVFEAAESQNVASVATNLLNQQSVLLGKEHVNNEWKLSLPNYPTIDFTNDDNEQQNYEDDQSAVHFTTESTEIELTDATKSDDVTTEETVGEVTTQTPEIETTAQEVSTTSEALLTTVSDAVTVAYTDEVSSTQQPETTTELPVTTTNVPEFTTPRVLGTSTTTEISLETEICYRGRCVKTKVDADQMPIDKK